MTTKPAERVDQRTPLSRRRILAAALRYIDQHGLDALSMRKLGTDLGVQGMSLYNHVANKNDLLDGVVEVLWLEIEAATTTRPDSPDQTDRSNRSDGIDWRGGVRAFAHAMRDVVRRHPNAAPLILSHQLMPQPALRLIQTHIATAVAEGIPERRAYDLLRTITSYALGSSLAEIQWGLRTSGCAPAVSDLLQPGTPGELAGVAEIFCGQAEPDQQFELGLDLMLRGIECAPDPAQQPR